tara:strand:+ start:827 stop:1471 length:645 start_codon:yes stop_codon:yes gene_type:complete
MIKDIDKKTYHLNEAQFYPEKIRKEKIIVGHTYSPDLQLVNGWFTREGGKYCKVPHFTIDKDGKIYQHIDPSFYCDFLQKKMIDKESISILLVNEGWLENHGSVYLDWANREYIGNEDGIISRKWRDKQYWAPYGEEQMLSLNELCLYLTNKFGIERNVMDHNVFDKDVVQFKGITFRSNFLKHYTDISPAFDIDNFKKLITKIKKKLINNETV